MAPPSSSDQSRSIDQWRVSAIANQLSTLLRSHNRSSKPPELQFQEGEMKRFAQYVLTCDEWKYDTVHVTDLISLGLVPTAWPSEGFPALREAAGEAATSGVCGRVWKQDELAYKCKTCERDPTCVVCVQCFKNGDHTGHDYAMVRTSGGCCDCGDVQAWRPDGFCRNHKGAFPEDADPGLGLSPALERNLREAVESVAMYVLTLAYRSQCDVEPPPSHSVVSHAAALLDWLTQIVQVGDGIRRVVGLILIARSHRWSEFASEDERQPIAVSSSNPEEAKFSWLSAMLEIDGVDKLPDTLQSSLHALYFQLITDLVFKRAFLELFVSNYERYIHAQIASKRKKQAQSDMEQRGANTDIDIVDNFTVQLFTVPALVPVMIRRGGLLDILLDLLLNLFETSSKPVALYSRAVPFAKSDFAKNWERRKGFESSSQPIASSSTSPPPRRRRNRLPIPLSVYEVRKNEDVPSKALGSEPRTLSVPILPLVPPDIPRRRVRVTQVELSRGETQENNAIDTTANGIDARQTGRNDEGLTGGPVPDPEGARNDTTLNEPQQPDAERIVDSVQAVRGMLQRRLRRAAVAAAAVASAAAAAAAAGVNVDSQGSDTATASDDGNEVMITEENDTFSDVQELVTEDETPDREQDRVTLELELADGTGGDHRVLVIMGEETEDGLLDNGDEEPQQGEEAEASIAEQLVVFESGLHFTPHEDARLAPAEEANTPFISAVRAAREMEEDACLGTGPLAHTMRLSWANGSHGHRKISDWVCVRVVNDLKYVLTHRDVAFHLVHVRKDLFRKFIRIMSMAQGMHPAARRFKDHVALEGDSWADSFTIEIEFYHYVELLAAAFCGYRTRESSSTKSEMKQDHSDMDLHASRLECIRIVRSCLDDWIEREEAIESRSVFADESFTVSHSVSVHLPLHRLMAFMVHHVVHLDNVDVSTALGGGEHAGCTTEDAKRLLRHPLRVQSFLAQVRAGMWRRNGHPVVGQSMFYRSVYCSEWFVDLDIFLQQCCATVLGPCAFIHEAQDAFRICNLAAVIHLCSAVSGEKHESEVNDIIARALADEITPRSGRLERLSRAEKDAKAEKEETILSARDIGFYPLAPRRYVLNGLFSAPTIPDAGNTKSELAGFAPTLVEDLLTYIVRISFERARCGAREAEFLRRKLLHQLCSRDRTHSQLYKACPYRICSELNGIDADANLEGSDSLVESTLTDIAHYIEPRGMDQGKYRLRDEMWGEFDPFTPHLSSRDRCAAEVRHAAACKRQNRKMQVIPEDNVNLRPIFPQLMRLKELSVALSHRNGLATTVLRQVLQKKEGPHSVEGAVSAALHFVCAAVELSEDSSVAGARNYWLDDLVRAGHFSESAPSIICQVYNLAVKSESNPFTEFVPVLERILMQAYERGNAALREHLSGIVPSLTARKRPTEAGLEGAEELTPEQLKRKALLRKKKEQQAAAMARMRMAQEKFAKHIDDEKNSRLEGEQHPSSESQQINPVALDLPTQLSTENESQMRDDSYMPRMKRARGASAEYRDETAEECALCHDVGSADGNRLLGYIGFHQQTRLPGIAQDQCKNPQGHYMGGPFFTSQSEKATAPPKSKGPRRRESATSQAQTQGLSSDAPGGSPPRSATSKLHSAYFLNAHMLENGIEGGPNMHLSFCGHAIHIHCFHRYFSSLMNSRSNQHVFEGYNVINLDRLEFLCPVCRRLANTVLPIMHGVLREERDDNNDPHCDELTHAEWIERCELEFCEGWSRSQGERHCLSRRATNATTAVAVLPTSKAEMSNAMNALRDSILNRAKAILHGFGLQGLLSPQNDVEGSPSEPDNNSTVLDSYAKLRSAAISSVVCAEVTCRSEVWNGANLQVTRRSLSLVVREARAQICLEPEPRQKGLVELWKVVRTAQGASLLDPFAATAFLFLLWPEPLNFYEARNIVRLGLCLIPHGKVDEGSVGPIAHVRYCFNVLLFLRRAALFVSAFFDSHGPPPLASYESKTIDGSHNNVQLEIQALLRYFCIPIDSVADAQQEWIAGHRPELDSVPFSFRPRRIGLVELPQLFQTLLEDLDGRHCASCHKAPMNPALCLVCGDLLCSSCKSGKLFAHSKECGAGIGVFLVLKNTNVHIIRSERTSLWGSPYLDAHGEEDKKFSRGKPLYLNRGRYASLERLWLMHGFDQDSRILNATTVTLRHPHVLQPAL